MCCAICVRDTPPFRTTSGKESLAESHPSIHSPGKSTLLRCVNLLETPTSGKIFFEDTEITDPKVDINQVRSKLGMVFQSFNLFPHLTAKKNVMLAQRKVLKRSEEEAD